MTDRELVLELCNRLRLKKSDIDCGHPGCDFNSFYEEKHTETIEISQSSDGYGRYYMAFDFDDDGSFTGYGVWE